jgi:hypothetical protein
LYLHVVRHVARRTEPVVSREYYKVNTTVLHQIYQEQFGNTMKLSGMPGARDTIFSLDTANIQNDSTPTRIY